MRTVLMFLSQVFYFLAHANSESEVILNHSNNVEFLMLKCNITDDGCCEDMKEVEYFKNGEGVCTLSNCEGQFESPLNRDDTEYYKCGCLQLSLRKTYLYVTKSRPSDFGNWTCGCLDQGSGINCKSRITIISKAITEENGRCPLANTTPSCLQPFYLVGFFAIIFTVLLIAVVMVCILRRNMSRHVKVIKVNCLTQLLIGKGKSTQDETEMNLLEKREGNQNSLADEDKRVLLKYLFKHAPDNVYNAVCKVFQPDWCQCGCCQELKTGDQNICCRERGVRNGCFSQSKKFKVKCLDKKEIFKFYENLKKPKTADDPTFIQKKYEIPDTWETDPPDKKTSESFRALAYAICKDILPQSDKGVFYPVPACCKWAIRKAHFDPDYEYLT